MPLVSVIVNAYNGAATLAETLDSIVAQTLTDYEIVFWDDASTDGTAAIAARYSVHRMRYFRSQGPRPLGLGAARQAAIEAARGDWIAFVDQDDVWLPRNLEMQMAVAACDPAIGLVFGRALRFWPHGRERDFDQVHEFASLPEGMIFERLWTGSCFICISAATMRIEALRTVGPIPPEITIIPDYYLFLGIARNWKVGAVQQVVCRYRMHAGNSTLRSGIRMQTEILMLIDRWRPEIATGVAQWRHRVHSTVLAVEEIRRPHLRRAGLRRLFADGSLTFLFSRPFVWIKRGLRRRLSKPSWVTQGLAK